ncbi:MAG: copper resistance protein B [Gammaproteobacteria bacterium]|nr:copper resistance protein B [Gammaproteobacteria bacterium]
MKKLMAVLLLSPALLFSAPLWAMGGDDPLIGKVMLNNVELQSGDGSPLSWAGSAWLGKDLNKLWFKTEGSSVDGETEAEIQLLYSRAIAPFWDVQVGWRGDVQPTPRRDWFAVSLLGLAPYLFEVDVSLFVADGDQVALRLMAEYEYMFTQKLIVSPEVELNLHSSSEPALGIGSGLSDVSMGLRLRYEIRREFAPYIGVESTRLFGDSAHFATTAGESDHDVRGVIGLRAWF